MKWSDPILRNLYKELQEDKKWQGVYNKLKKPSSKVSVHLAIFSEPYLTYLLKGKKTIESRFSLNRIHPHGNVSKGDIVVVKKTGGAVMGFFQVTEVIFSDQLNQISFNQIKKKYSKGICSNIDPNFWLKHQSAKFATLIRVGELKKMQPFFINKKDRRGWVILNNYNKNH